MASLKSPKNVKSKDEDNLWRTVIETAQLNDNDFKLKVVILEAAGGEQDLIYLSKFESFVQNDKRFVIKNIAKTETVFMINQLGTEKKERSYDLRVFEEAYESLKQDKNVLSTDIAALVIKHLAIDMKQKYIDVQRQKLELIEGIKLEGATMIDKAEVKGKKFNPVPVPVEPVKSAKGKSKKKPEPEPIGPKEGKKYDTTLREHGEEWRDKQYVDDFPVDGPDIYIAITGFTDPLLPSKLVSIGIPLVAIVQVRVDPKCAKIPPSLQRVSKRGQSKCELLAEQASKFWDDIQSLRITPDVKDEYKDIAFIAFKPPYWDGDNLKGDPEAIYDDISFLLYDIQDLSRQHANYLDNLDVIEIAKEKPEYKYIHRYFNLINKIPMECTTVFFILDSILNAIDGNNDEENSCRRKEISKRLLKTNEAASVPSTTFGLNRLDKAKNLVKGVFESFQDAHEEDTRKKN